MISADLVGVPWLDLGRTVSGADCWGIVWIAFERIGITLPSYADLYTSAADRAEVHAAIEGNMSDWSEVLRGDERQMDVVLMLDRGQPHHVGLITTPGMMLHMRMEQDSCVEPYTTGRYSRIVQGIYRHRELA